MERRKFLALIGSVPAWPLDARAQTALPVIGFLSARSPAESAHLVAAFRRGLAEMGFVEGQNVWIEYRWADGQYDRLGSLAAELVALRVDVIASAGGTPSALAAKAASDTIPIVFLSGADPVKAGLVSSLSRPGGNVTGVSQFVLALVAKGLALLVEIIPASTAVVLLVNPHNPLAGPYSREAEQAARVLRRDLQVLEAGNLSQLEAAFSANPWEGRALLVVADPFLDSRREQVVALAARYSVPALYLQREYVLAGGLMSYGMDFAASYRQSGVYVGRVLKGEKPADLPVPQPTKFELVINMKTAKTLGLAVPLSVIAQADEIIE